MTTVTLSTEADTYRDVTSETTGVQPQYLSTDVIATAPPAETVTRQQESGDDSGTIAGKPTFHIT